MRLYNKQYKIQNY